MEAGLVDGVPGGAELGPAATSAKCLTERYAIAVRHDVVQNGIDGAGREEGKMESCFIVYFITITRPRN